MLSIFNVLVVLVFFFLKVVRRTDHQYFTNTYLTEEKDSDHWNYTIRTSVSFLDPTSASCHGWDDSTVVTATVHSPKPRGKTLEVE